ncbi:MAG: hypothetical protein Q7J56_01820 [Deltaproteobacteria bacterium]|nr:hypothetical protein [Deltaproteobacteria bacterium]
MFKKVRLGTVFLLALLFGVAITGPASAQENLGNFPDAIEVSAEFGTFDTINGEPVPSVTGFLFRLTNTSFGTNGGYEAFAQDPDGDFAVRDVLTGDAASKIANAQPFGIYSFGALLPEGSGAVTSAPDGFDINFDDLDAATGMREINFTIDLKNPSGLIFDAKALSIPAKFTIPQFGPVYFFISTPSTFTLGDLPQVRNDPGIDISTQMAWAENGKVKTKFNLNGRSRRLRPRGEVMPEEAAPPQTPPV